MDYWHPCSLTVDFIIVSEKTYINMAGFRILYRYLYDVLIQPSSNITSPTTSIIYCRKKIKLQTCGQLYCSLATTHKDLYISISSMFVLYVTYSFSYICTSNPCSQTFPAICHTETPVFRELGLVTATKTSSQDTNPKLTPNTLCRSNKRSPNKSINFIDHQEDWQFSELHGNLYVMVGQNLWRIRPY